MEKTGPLPLTPLRLPHAVGPEPTGQSFALPASSAAAWQGGGSRPAWTSDRLGQGQGSEAPRAELFLGVGWDAAERDGDGGLSGHTQSWFRMQLCPSSQHDLFPVGALIPLSKTGVRPTAPPSTCLTGWKDLCSKYPRHGNSLQSPLCLGRTSPIAGFCRSPDSAQVSSHRRPLWTTPCPAGCPCRAPRAPGWSSPPGQ